MNLSLYCILPFSSQCIIVFDSNSSFFNNFYNDLFKTYVICTPEILIAFSRKMLPSGYYIFCYFMKIFIKWRQICLIKTFQQPLIVLHKDSKITMGAKAFLLSNHFCMYHGSEHMQGSLSHQELYNLLVTFLLPISARVLKPFFFLHWL